MRYISMQASDFLFAVINYGNGRRGGGGEDCYNMEKLVGPKLLTPTLQVQDRATMSMAPLLKDGNFAPTSPWIKLQVP